MRPFYPTRWLKRLQRLDRVRGNKIRDIFHKTSRLVVNSCIQHDLGTIVIGYNSGWKQGCALGRRANQAFVFLPFNLLFFYLWGALLPLVFFLCGRLQKRQRESGEKEESLHIGLVCEVVILPEESIR